MNTSHAVGSVTVNSLCTCRIVPLTTQMLLDAVVTSLQRRTVTQRWDYRGDGCEGNSRECGYVPTFRTYLLPTHCTTWAPLPSARCRLSSIYTKDQRPPRWLIGDGCYHCTGYGAHWHTGRTGRCCGFNGWQYLKPNLGCLAPGRLPHVSSIITGKTFYERAVPHCLLNNYCTFCTVLSSLCAEYTEGPALCSICRFRVTSGIALWTLCETSRSLSMAPHAVATCAL